MTAQPLHTGQTESASLLDDLAAAPAPLAPAELAKMVAERIRSDPDSYYQRAWLLEPAEHDGAPRAELPWASDVAELVRRPEGLRCGTSACVAGWAAVEAIQADPSLPVEDYLVRDLAARALGLTAAQAERLFFADNSSEEVLAMLDALAEGVKP